MNIMNQEKINNKPQDLLEKEEHLSFFKKNKNIITLVILVVILVLSIISVFSFVTFLKNKKNVKHTTAPILSEQENIQKQLEELRRLSTTTPTEKEIKNQLAELKSLSSKNKPSASSTEELVKELKSLRSK